jgi:hypothetical protein
MMSDEDINTTPTPTPTPTPAPAPLGPITRARAHQLNHQVSSFLNSCPSYLDNGDACTLVLLRNDGEDQKGRGLAPTGFGLQDSTNLWWMRLHTDSDWDVLALFGKLIKSNFQRIHPHGYILLDSSAVTIFVPKLFCQRCCVTLFWADGPCIKLGSLGTRPRVGEWPKHTCGRPPIYLYASRAATNRLGFVSLS